MRWRKALILGSLREDVLYLPGICAVTEYPSFSHFCRPGVPGGYVPFVWPGPHHVVRRLHRRACEASARDDIASAFVQLGRLVHVLTDMSIPAHAFGIA